MAQPTRVQGKSFTGGQTNGNLDATPTVGNTLLLFLPGTTATSAISVSSSGVSNWARVDANLPYSVQRYIDVWRGDVTSTPANANIAWAVANNVFVFEYTNLAGYTVNGGQSSGTNNAGSTTPTTAAATPASGNEVFLIANTSRTGSLASGPTGGFTDDVISTSQKFATKYVALANGSDSHQAVWTYTASAAWDAFITVFEQAASDTLSVTTQPSTAASGDANSPAIVVESSDNTFTGDVTLAKKTGKGTLSGTLTVAAVAGVATFSNVIVTGAGPHVLTASATGHTDVDTNSFTVTNAITTAIQAFIDAHGGDSKYQAFAHHLVNTTLVSGKASQWDDVRGLLSGGMVPPVQATASKRPVADASGLIFTAADSCEMLSALDSRIVANAAGGMWALVICRSAGASMPILVISEDPSDIDELPYFVVGTNASRYEYRYNVGATDVDVTTDLGTAPSSAVRAIMLCREPTHAGSHAGDYTLKAVVFGRGWRYHVAQSAPSSTGSGMAIGLGQFNGTFADVTVLGLVASTQPLSVSLLEDLDTLVQAQYGVTLDLARRAPIVAGTSTDRAHNTTHPVGSASGEDGTTTCDYVAANISPTWASRGLDADIFAMNASANGTWIDDQDDLFPDRFLLESAIARPGNLIYEIGGVATQLLQSPYNGVGGDALLIAVLEDFIADLDAAGFSVVLRTIMDYGGLSGGGFTGGFYDQPGDVLNQIGDNALALNTWMRTTALALDGVVGVIDFEAQAGDIAKIDRVGSKAYADSTYFDGSGHPTTAHHALMGQVKRDFYDANDEILYPDFVNESLTSSDSSTAALTTAADTAESLSATDSQASALTTAVAVTESATAADSQTAALQTAAAIVETLSATDEQDATITGANQGDTAETLSASDAQTANMVAVASIVESLGAADAVGATVVYAGVAVAETLSATDAQDAILGDVQGPLSPGAQFVLDDIETSFTPDLT